MMTQKKSSRWLQAKVLTAIPVAAMAVVAFANPRTDSVAGMVAAADAGAGPSAVVADSARQVKTFDQVDQMPEFSGGTVELMKFLTSNMKYPKDAEAAGIEGRVIVTFVVDADGSVVEPRVARSVSPSLDSEALRVIGLMPKWIPGRQGGKAVRVKYTIPLSFKLQGQGKTK